MAISDRTMAFGVAAIVLSRSHPQAILEGIRNDGTAMPGLLVSICAASADVIPDTFPEFLDANVWKQKRL